MKKFIFAGFFAAVAVVTTAFTFQNFSTSKKELPCTKFYQTCPGGLVYYKCVKTSTGQSSPDCYNVASGPNSGGCNITLYPCGGRQ
ncbi:hypothetical protein [Fluviicola sp.]|uniref:hypothetical protein n=1 Tax=Fluviicola sp. TaxID=1917219 RepID=UPI00261DCE39|nr:hypothetical protein [Fluviicola sp.]